MNVPQQVSLSALYRRDIDVPVEGTVESRQEYNKSNRPIEPFKYHNKLHSRKYGFIKRLVCAGDIDEQRPSVLFDDQSLG